MLRNLLKIGIVLMLIFSVVAINSPILLKWVFGTARIIGKPVKAIVYTNGRINNGIKVYRVDAYWSGEKTNDYLLGLTEFDTEGMLKFINIDLKEKWIGRPVCTNTDCYNLIGGYLFQSETGGHFDPFEDDMKGYNFNPQLSFTDRQIRFNIPPNTLSFDSIRIELTKD
jgi:hypothetical protein